MLTEVPEQIDSNQNSKKRQEDLSSRKRNFVELVRITSMQSEQLDSILPVMVHQGMIFSGTNADIERVVELVRERILKDEFIEQFFLPFNDTFSQEEIQQLISIYKSEAMRKFQKRSMKLFHPLYEAYRKMVAETIKEVGLIDQA